MLTHIVPKFEKGRILKTEMLENLRDYPRSFLDIRYQDFSDGIITGMNVTVGENTLTIGRGIVKHKDRLYLLEQEQEVPYAATGRLSVLKLLFWNKQIARISQPIMQISCWRMRQRSVWIRWSWADSSSKMEPCFARIIRILPTWQPNSIHGVISMLLLRV